MTVQFKMEFSQVIISPEKSPRNTNIVNLTVLSPLSSFKKILKIEL